MFGLISTKANANGAIAPTRSAGAATEEGVQLSPIEQEILEEHDSLIEMGRELAELQRIPTGDRTPEQETRMAELLQAQQQIREAFQEFLARPDVEATIAQLRQSQRQQTLDLRSIEALQDNLRQLEQEAVLLYPLILEDRLELVLLTADAPPIRRSINVSQTELNQTVLEFRQALQNPRSNPQTSAQQLYNWLIQPFENELEAADADAILYAPDGVLRYVPLAALHTGEQWLVENYIVNTITAASLTDFGQSPQQPPRVLAAAHTEGSFEVTVGDRSLQLSGFQFAAPEVEAIAELMPDTTVLLNDEFTPDNLFLQMNDYTIVHIAANVWIVPSGPDDSFILFGNGDRVSLSDMRNWNLSNVDLLVLSACETGVGETLGSGDEILGFGYTVQRAGARAAIAPLWQVDDFGTKELMVAFYRSLQQGQSYAEALRQAQLSLITFESMPAPRQLKGIEVGAPVEAPVDRQGRFSHPYYWAPFILIGNGL
ncbi:MAG: CHAT domain-containing protein [Elainellaceae cyanobacterium]